jgi:hypothetical protein
LWACGCIGQEPNEVIGDEIGGAFRICVPIVEWSLQQAEVAVEGVLVPVEEAWRSEDDRGQLWVLAGVRNTDLDFILAEHQGCLDHQLTRSSVRLFDVSR